jgi:hypothetical protein
VRRMLLAVAAGAVGMMVLAQVATAMTLAPLGLPEPWELGGPPAAVAPGGPSGPAVAPVLDPVAASTGLPAPAAAPPPSTAPAATRAAAATPERRAAAPAPASRAASAGAGTAGSSSGSSAPATAAAADSSGSGSPAPAARSASGGSGGSGSSSAPLAKVCLKPVLGGCLQLG